MLIPTIDEVDRIKSIADPVNRNLQITHCYWELSHSLKVRTGLIANWCTFATWASKQAGVTIRGEDLERTIENALRNEPEIQKILSLIEHHSQKLGSAELNDHIHDMALRKVIKSAVLRASDAVARGNKKVYEEIGREFARFLASCMQDENYNQVTIDEFCKKLIAGPPPDGQDFLDKAFRGYYSSFYETDPKKKDEMRLLANLRIGFHEQTRLQPEITESLNAGLVDPQYVINEVAGIKVKSNNLFGKMMYFIQWLIGKTNLFKKAIESLVNAAEKHIRKIITKEMMTIAFPPDIIIRLGQDLNVPFPENLKQLQNSELVALLAKIDTSVDSTIRDAAVDWSVLQQRLHFIADLFRCYDASNNLFDAAFTTEQIEIIRSGGLPEGSL